MTSAAMSRERRFCMNIRSIFMLRLLSERDMTIRATAAKAMLSIRALVKRVR